MAKGKGNFLLRKLKQLGRKLDLIDAAYFAEVFFVLLKYRGKQGTLTQVDRAFLVFVLQNQERSQFGFFSCRSR